MLNLSSRYLDDHIQIPKNDKEFFCCLFLDDIHFYAIGYFKHIINFSHIFNKGIATPNR